MPQSLAVLKHRALLVLGMLILQACSVELYNGLDQRQANEIVATLTRHGIPAQRDMNKDGSMTVSIENSRFADAVAILDENGLPKQEFANLGEIFKRDGLVSSPVEFASTGKLGTFDQSVVLISPVKSVSG